MAIGAKEYIETVTYLSKMYDFFNEKLFRGELIKPVITISPDEKNKAYGWITRDKLWKENENDEGMYEINLSAQFLNRSISETSSTLIHEMCHQFARVNDFQDTTRSGSYHNKADFLAKDQGGYELLDLMFTIKPTVDLVMWEEKMTDDKGNVTAYNVYEARVVDEDGLVYAYKLKLARESAKSYLNIFMQLKGA